MVLHLIYLNEIHWPSAAEGTELKGHIPKASLTTVHVPCDNTVTGGCPTHLCLSSKSDKVDSNSGGEDLDSNPEANDHHLSCYSHLAVATRW